MAYRAACPRRKLVCFRGLHDDCWVWKSNNITTHHSPLEIRTIKFNFNHYTIVITPSGFSHSLANHDDEGTAYSGQLDGRLDQFHLCSSFPFPWFPFSILLSHALPSLLPSPHSESFLSLSQVNLGWTGSINQNRRSRFILSLHLRLSSITVSRPPSSQLPTNHNPLLAFDCPKMGTNQMS